MRWRRRSRRRILLRCRIYFKAINSLRLNCDFEIHRSQSWHNVLLFTHNVIHTNQTFQATHCIVSMAWQSHSCCTKSTDLECLTKTKVPRVAQKCSEFFYIVLAWSESPKQFVIVVHFALLNGPKMTRIQIELKLDTNAKCETKRHIWGVFVLQKGSHNFDIGTWSNSFMVLWGAFEEGTVSNYQVIWLYSSELFSQKNLAI